MIDLTPSAYLQNYAQLRSIIAQCRVQFDASHLQVFAFQAVECVGEDGRYDEHLYERMALMLALSQDFNQDDRPLVRWLIKQNTQLFNLGFDISQETALCAFMLYKYMTEEDILVLYACKFAYGSSEHFAVDMEMALGFGLDETLHYLQNHHNEPLHAQMKQAIEEYCANGVVFKPRTQFIDFFEQRRFGYLQEEVATCYGFLTEND